MSHRAGSVNSPEVGYIRLAFAEKMLNQLPAVPFLNSNLCTHTKITLYWKSSIRLYRVIKVKHNFTLRLLYSVTVLLSCRSRIPVSRRLFVLSQGRQPLISKEAGVFEHVHTQNKSAFRYN